MNKRTKFLNEVDGIVTRDRNDTYGGPEDSFLRIAKMWDTYLGCKYGFSNTINVNDVAVMMILMKTARLIENPSHRDSWLDIAGYAACGGTVNDEDDPQLELDFGGTTKVEEEVEPDLLSVTCPYCEAEPNFPCRSIVGGPDPLIGYVHHSRREKAYADKRRAEAAV